MNLSDEVIASEVLLAFRRIGAGEASIDLAAGDCFRSLLGLSHERVPAYDAKPMGRAMNLPNAQTGD